jgi:hypothetical protein
MPKLTKTSLLNALASLPEDKRAAALRHLTNGMLDTTSPIQSVDPLLVVEVGLALLTGKKAKRTRIPAPRAKRGIGSY